MNLLIYLIQTLKVNVVFSPSNYMELLPERIDGDYSFLFLGTFVGRKRDFEEFLMRGLDIIGSLAVLVVLAPVLVCISFLVKVSSNGPVFYTQKRVGKNGKVFTLYKFRTMVRDTACSTCRSGS